MDELNVLAVRLRQNRVVLAGVIAAWFLLVLVAALAFGVHVQTWWLFAYPVVLGLPTGLTIWLGMRREARLRMLEALVNAGGNGCDLRQLADAANLSVDRARSHVARLRQCLGPQKTVLVRKLQQQPGSPDRYALTPYGSTWAVGQLVPTTGQ